LLPQVTRPDLVFGVVLLPVLDDGRIVLVRIWRHALERLSWESVCGFVDDGETIETAARRELVEEVGLACSARDLVPLGFCAPEGSTSAPSRVGRRCSRRWRVGHAPAGSEAKSGSATVASLCFGKSTTPLWRSIGTCACCARLRLTIQPSGLPG
jgi:8-oxo-dGTP pyrophosphatase MutT (NUDIX family)